MKIYDCTTFYSEHMMMDVRFSILNKYVEKNINNFDIVFCQTIRVAQYVFNSNIKKKILDMGQ